jgi:hypothetical protein
MTLGRQEWNSHAELIGRVTLSWNQNVHQLLRIFSHLTGLGSPLAEALFFSHQSDRGQRQLIRRTADAVGLRQEHKTGLFKLIKRLDDVSTGRNLAVHTVFGVSLFDPGTGAWDPTVVPALKPSQDPRLEPDFSSQFERVDRKLGAIHRDMEDWLVHTPFPERAWGMPPFVGREQLSSE